MATAPTLVQGASRKFSIQITREDNVTLEDPATLLFVYSKPGAVTTTLSVAATTVIRDSAGLYHVVLTLDQPGQWTYAWKGTNNANGYGQLGTLNTFNVDKSVI